jgi:hypothetical protein
MSIALSLRKVNWRLLILAFAFAAIPSFAVSQAVQWTTTPQSQVFSMFPGSDGTSIYTTNGRRPDTLYKWDGNGTLIFAASPGGPIDTIVQAATGTFVELYPTSVAFVHDDGSVKWTINVPSTLGEGASLGNKLWFIKNAVSDSLLSIDTTGAITAVPLPTFPSLKGGYGATCIGGPYFNGSGNAWVVGTMLTHVTKVGSGAALSNKTSISYYASLVNPATGTPAAPSTSKAPWFELLKNQMLSDTITTGKGVTTWLLNYGVLTPFNLVNGNLTFVSWYRSYLISSPDIVHNSYQEVRIGVLSSAGKFKLVKRTGKYSFSCDGLKASGGGEFWQAAVGAGDALFLDGTWTTGKATCSSDNSVTNQELLNFNPSTLSVTWDKLSLHQPADLITVDNNTGQVIVGSTGPAGGLQRAMVEYNADGSTVTTLVWPDIYSQFFSYGGALYGMLYTYSDPSVWYAAKMELPSLALHRTKPAEPEAARPNEFSLQQNYPNPFNPVTTIHYELPKESVVRLAVFNVLGQQVRALVNQTEQAGYKSVQFDGSNLPSGIYFYRITAGAFEDVKRMVLIK